jgi:2-keto-4-pentenoate hydratase/2-oxohepta-3-ene-1,7-dioic acid hydratase in catechol pathway
MKLIGIGRNYIEHAKELNNLVPTEPVIFLMPDTALLRNNDPFYIPSFTNEVHYEVEIVVRINRIGKNIAQKFAHRYYDEIGIGIDFTARDLQLKLKSKGLPWANAKAFDYSAPISGTFINKSEFSSVENIDFSLMKNGELVQKGNTSEMIFNIDELISYVSRYYTLKIGDLIYTGTPPGVGKIEIGDKLEALIGNRNMLVCNIL